MIKKIIRLVLCSIFLTTIIPDMVMAKDSTNFALGKPYTASPGLMSTFGKKETMVTDGNKYSSSYVSATGTPASVTVDLKTKHTIDTIKIWHYWADGRTYHNSKVEVSEDGNNWTEIFNSATSGEYPETEHGKIHKFNPILIRYIRDTINGSTVNTGNQWVEIEAFGPEQVGSDSEQNLPIYNDMESTSGITGTGTKSLSQDRVQGNYALKVVNSGTGEVSNTLTYNTFDATQYSQINVWVKPAAGANYIKFAVIDNVSGNTSLISNDIDRDGRFEIGEDLISGKWNLVTLDVTDNVLSSTQVKDFIFYLSGNSTWYLDEITSVYAPKLSLDITKMSNTSTQVYNNELQFKPYVTNTSFNTTPTIVQSQENPDYNSPPLAKGKLSKIYINSSYKKIDQSSTNLDSKRKYLSGFKPKMVALSGDGRRIFYINPNVSDTVYMLDLYTGENKQISTYSAKEIATNQEGTSLVLKTTDNKLRWQNPIYTPQTLQLYANTVTSFYMRKDGKIVYYDSVQSRIETFLYPSILEGVVYTGPVTNVTMAQEKDQIFFSNTTQLYSLVSTPAGWKSNLLTTATNNIDGLWSNKDGSIIFFKTVDGIFSYQMPSKALRKLDIQSATVVKVTDDNKLIIQDENYEYLNFDPDTDVTKNIRPSDAKNPSTSTEILFDMNSVGAKMAYVSNDGSTDGLSTIYIDGAQRPERYLFSFDRRYTWYTYKDGVWTLVKVGTAPITSDFDTYGMTIDEVNALTENDFETLYADKKEVLHFDVAVYFASVDPYTTPSLKAISLTLKGKSKDLQQNGLEKFLYVKKQQDFNATKWRQVKKVYPVEINPKEAETYYFLSKTGATYKSYKNNQWVDVDPNLLSNIETSWITIIQQGMTVTELRAIPEDQLNKEFLPADSFSVIYYSKIDDDSTEGYSSQINVDYIESQFNSTNQILKITLTDGTVKQYDNLTKAEIEDFINWMNERQLNRGPIFWCFKTASTTSGIIQVNEYINYYLIQSVAVEEKV